MCGECAEEGELVWLPLASRSAEESTESGSTEWFEEVRLVCCGVSTELSVVS